MALEGIAKRLHGIIPRTLDMLLSEGATFGEERVKERVAVAKALVLGDSPPPDNELPLLVQDFIAKVAAIELLGAGIDEWMDKPITKNTSGSAEVVTWEERLDSLRKRKAELITEVAGLEPDISVIVKRSRKKGIPGLTTLNDPMITPDPLLFPPAYARTER